MSKKGWIILLVVIGAGIAVAIGFAANSQSRAEKEYCDSLNSLESSLQALTSLNPSSATQDDFQSDVDAVQEAWGSVKSDAKNLSDANQSQLESAWDSFSDAVKGIPDDASVSDAEQAISASAQGLTSAVKTSLQSYDCSSSSSSSSSG